MIHAWWGRKICSAHRQEDQDWHDLLRRSSLHLVHLVQKHANPTKGTNTGTSPPCSSPQYVPPPPERHAVHSSPTDSFSATARSSAANVMRQSLLDSCGRRTACPLRERSLATRDADPAMATLRSGWGSCQHHDSADLMLLLPERRFSRPLGMTRGQFSGTVFRSPIRP